MPWPIWFTAEYTSITPLACTSTVTRSSNALPPVHSRNVAMPSPRHSPRALDCAARASNPAQSASGSTWSSTCSKRPVS